MSRAPSVGLRPPYAARDTTSLTLIVALSHLDRRTTTTKHTPGDPCIELALADRKPHRAPIATGDPAIRFLRSYWQGTRMGAPRISAILIYVLGPVLPAAQKWWVRMHKRVKGYRMLRRGKGALTLTNPAFELSRL